MPLPQQVINQLNRDPVDTPGWSFGIIFFAAGLFGAVLIIYFVMIFGYEPYLNSQISKVQNQTAALSQSISSQDQTNFLTFYSQISNLQTLLSQHVLLSQFFAWLEQNTEANVYYTSFAFSSNDQVTLAITAKTEADVNQQIAIFQASPEVENMVVSNISNPGTGGFQFSATLLVNPSLFTEQIATST